MKNPLFYQTTEYDCGPTALLNAIRFLFEREEIYPEIVKHIMMYSLDAYNEKGEFGKKGTSAMAMMFLSSWLNHFGKVKKFPIQCDFLTGKDVNLSENSKIISGLQQGGAVVTRVRYDCWHYVLLTGLHKDGIELFDPYYRDASFKVPGIEMINDKPLSANRRVSFERMSGTGKQAYAFGPMDTREAVVVFNRRTQKTPARTIEYFI